MAGNSKWQPWLLHVRITAGTTVATQYVFLM